MSLRTKTELLIENIGVYLETKERLETVISWLQDIKREYNRQGYFHLTLKMDTWERVFRLYGTRKATAKEQRARKEQQIEDLKMEADLLGYRIVKKRK